MSDTKFTNFIFPIFLVFSGLGLYWLTRLGLDAGEAYLWLIVLGGLFLAIGLVLKFALKVEYWFEIPINRSASRAVLALLFGIMFLGIIILISKLTGSNFYSTFTIAPLASFSAGFGAETFAALSVATSPFWNFFIIVIAAAVIEELVLGWAFVNAGSYLAKGLRTLLKIDFDEGNHYWDFTFAMIFSIVFFSILHYFNGSYLDAQGNMIIGLFVYAALFRLILNIMIYKFANLGLMFSIGVHSLHNAIVLGSGVVIAAIFTFPGGIILDLIFLVIIFFAISSVPELIREGRLIYEDFLTFD